MNLQTAIRSEVGAFSARKSILNTVSRLFPHHTLARTRTDMLRRLGLQVGAKSTIQGPVRITGEGSVSLFSIGSHTHITGPLNVDLSAHIDIGSNVFIGYDVSLITGHHEIGDASQRCGYSMPCPIKIDDGCWLGSNVIVMPGVRIYTGSVVAAGSVVVNDVGPNTLVGGTPAKLIRRLDEEQSGSYLAWKETAQNLISNR